MEEATVKVISASDISGDPEDTARIVLVPSGFKEQWIVVIEDIDYSISAKYMRPKDRFLLKDSRKEGRHETRILR